MAIILEPIEYEFDGLALTGFCAFEQDAPPRPGVLVVHSALGIGRFEKERAIALAEMGYVGFVADLYGTEAVYTTDDEAIEFARALVRTTGAFSGRMGASMHALREHPAVDATRTAALGFCLGGRAVLNLARQGDPVSGVISFHGGLMTSGDIEPIVPVRAKVLILHGWQDSYDPAEHIMKVGDELTELGADWQIHAYGGIGHAFTNPYKSSRGQFTRFDALTARRSWQALGNFLEELFPAH